MVVQRTLDNLKEKPHEEKKVVAGGIAIAVVIVLLIGWGFMFLRNIQRGSVIPTLQGSAVPDDQLNAQFVGQAQQQLNQYYQSASQRLRTIREEGSGGGSVNAGAGVAPNTEGSEFGAQNNVF